ncbi:hypothetical protein G7046_g6720 [Stylonectria norvegica]|nr:hypothetical protein G7046_g6720 [Stylonectria norvegica]
MAKLALHSLHFRHDLASINTLVASAVRNFYNEVGGVHYEQRSLVDPCQDLRCSRTVTARRVLLGSLAISAPLAGPLSRLRIRQAQGFVWGTQAVPISAEEASNRGTKPAEAKACLALTWTGAPFVVRDLGGAVYALFATTFLEFSQRTAGAGSISPETRAGAQMRRYRLSDQGAAWWSWSIVAVHVIDPGSGDRRPGRPRSDRRGIIGSQVRPSATPRTRMIDRSPAGTSAQRQRGRGRGANFQDNLETTSPPKPGAMRWLLFTEITTTVGIIIRGGKMRPIWAEPLHPSLIVTGTAVGSIDTRGLRCSQDEDSLSCPTPYVEAKRQGETAKAKNGKNYGRSGLKRGDGGGVIHLLPKDSGQHQKIPPLPSSASILFTVPEGLVHDQETVHVWRELHSQCASSPPLEDGDVLQRPSASYTTASGPLPPSTGGSWTAASMERKQEGRSEFAGPPQVVMGRLCLERGTGGVDASFDGSLSSDG